MPAGDTHTCHVKDEPKPRYPSSDRGPSHLNAATLADASVPRKPKEFADYQSMMDSGSLPYLDSSRQQLPAASLERGRQGAAANVETAPAALPATYSTQAASARSKNLSDPGLTVKRYAGTTSAVAWNSGAKAAEVCAREELPKIDTRKRNKYDQLSDGFSPFSASTVKSNQQQQPEQPQHSRTLREKTVSDSGSPLTQVYGLTAERLSARASEEPRATPDQAADGRPLPSRQATARSTTTSLELSGEPRTDLASLLRSLDFEEAAGDFSNEEMSPMLLRCQALFGVLTHGKECLTAEDLHELLVVFTPTGVAFHEAVDFLLSSCEHRAELSFADFLRFGDALRARVFAYEVFAPLSDTEKLHKTYDRVFRETDSAAVGEERNSTQCADSVMEQYFQLLRASNRQTDSTDVSGGRPLRVYERLFLADYQNALLDGSTDELSVDAMQYAISAASDAAGGDLCVSVHRAVTEESAANTASLSPREAQTADEDAAERTSQDDVGASPWERGHTPPSSQRNAPVEYRSASGKTESTGKASARGRKGASQKKRSQMREKTALSATNSVYRQSAGRGQTTAGSARATYKDRSATLVESNADATIAHQPSSARQCRAVYSKDWRLDSRHAKYMGYSVEAEYAERVVQDTELIQQLQQSYS